MRRVLVTGASGFVGRACLAPLRARGVEVHAVSRAARPAGTEHDIHWHRADLLTAGLADGGAAAVIAAVRPTHLLHLAWEATPGVYWTSRDNLRWVRASLALYEAFGAAGGARAVLAGTAAEYDWTGDGVLSEATTPLAPRTYYGTCKRALGDVVLADAAASGASTAWARLGFLYGPHEHPDRLVASVIGTLLRGGAARCSPGTQRRDFMHVDDAGAALVALLASDVRGAVNIASGAAVTVKSLVERVAEIVGGSGRVELGALPPDQPPLLVADVRRLRDEVGFVPARSADERLHDAIAWWKARA